MNSIAASAKQCDNLCIMHEKRFRDIVDRVESQYDRLAENVTRRDLLVGAGSFLGGAALTLAAVKIGKEGDTRSGEKERELGFATGIDISFPQGSAEQYENMRHDFVIVGVNGGKPGQRNPYLIDQLRVASVITQNADPNQTGMLPIQLYLNTANPADYVGLPELTSWPTSSDSDIERNPYDESGDCDGTDNQACMYTYGWQQAKKSVQEMFKEAADDAEVSGDPVDYTWWLDVETYNSWRENPEEDEDPQESNRVVLEGMVAYLHSIGAGVGLYSTRSHWNELIGGTVGENSNLYHLPSWIAKGTISEEEAKRILSEGEEQPFTPGGKVAIIQRVEGESTEAPGALDYNYAVTPN